MKILKMLVGPPGAGKSTVALKEICDTEEFIRINQDSQGKEQHLVLFIETLVQGKNIVVDRMNFNKEQRSRYLSLAKKAGYYAQIIVLHESYETCLKRCLNRTDHETIKNEKHARSALQTFFTKYERPTPDEADEINFRYPKGLDTECVIFDLDGTLCDITHRQHLVMNGNKDWKNFYKLIPYDDVNKQVYDILMFFNKSQYDVILCSGRDENQKKNTVEWLERYEVPYKHLFMRNRGDSRQDYVIKENILDFEILTRYKAVYLSFDDRDQVVKLWRSRQIKCFQVQEGNF